MMDHNQGVGVDAAASVAQDGGFCGPVSQSVHFEHASPLGWLGLAATETER